MKIKLLLLLAIATLQISHAQIKRIKKTIDRLEWASA